MWQTYKLSVIWSWQWRFWVQKIDIVWPWSSLSNSIWETKNGKINFKFYLSECVEMACVGVSWNDLELVTDKFWLQTHKKTSGFLSDSVRDSIGQEANPKICRWTKMFASSRSRQVNKKKKLFGALLNTTPVSCVHPSKWSGEKWKEMRNGKFVEHKSAISRNPVGLN